MKSLLISSTLLAAVANGVIFQPTLNKRQIQIPNIPGLGSFATKPAVVIDEKPKLRENAKRQILRFGPFTLPAMKENALKGDHGGMSMGGSSASNPFAALTKPMDPNGFSTMKMITGLCKDCTLLSSKSDVVYSNGTRADISNGIYLHHVIAMDLNKKEEGFVSTCPGNLSEAGQPKPPLMSTFLGGAVDEFTQYFTTPDGKFNSGYYLGKNDNFLMQAEIVNYRTTKQDVYLQFDVEWVPGKVGADVNHQVLNAAGCMTAVSGFGNGSPKGNVKSKGFGVTKDGFLLNARGHMHDGGTAVNLFLNDKEICSSKATYGGTGGSMMVAGKEWKTISRMSDCIEPVELKKGDYLRLEASWDTIEHPLRESEGEMQEGMGMMYFNFAPKLGGSRSI